MTDQFRTDITADRTQYDAAMDGAAQKALSTSQATASAWRESSIQIGRSIGEAVKGINGSFDSVVETIKKVRGVVAGIAAVAGGGAVFGKMISDTARMTQEVRLLSSALGITTEEASTLRVALGDIGLTSDDYTAMVGKLVVKLRDNEERFNELGIKTRGANGELLNTEQVVRNALSALEAFKAGTDRNLASSEVFGRGWNEVNRLMRLTPEVMEDARQKAEALQLTIGPEGAERARQFQLAMQGVKDVGEALANRIGQALMPILTDFGNWLSSLGPGAVAIMRVAVGGLAAAFNILLTSIIVTFKLAASTIYTLVEPIAAVAEAAALAMSGDFSGAADRLKQISGNISANWKKSLDDMSAATKKTAKEMAALFDPAAEQGQSKPKGDGNTYSADSRKGRMAKWDAELAAQRDAYDRSKLEQGSFEQFTKEMERDFWAAKLLIVRDGSEEQAQVLKKSFDLERQIRKQAYEGEIADVKEQMGSAQTSAEQRINLASRIAEMTAQHYGRASKEYKASLAEVQKATDEWSKEQMRLQDLVIAHDQAFQLSRVALERQHLDTLEKLGQITEKQKLQRLKELQDIEYQIEFDALQKKLELLAQDPGTNPVLYQEQLEKIEALKRQHAAKMAQIDDQMKIESVKVWGEIADSITGAFSTAIKGVIMGTQSISQAFHNMGQSVLLALVDMGVKAVAEMIKNKVIAIVLSKTTGVQEITDNAAIAASAAAASVAAIPIYGWAMAPEVAAETYAETAAWTGALAARQGFDVPSGVNPVTQLHQEEMVLPDHIANPLRDAISKGGVAGGDTYLTVKAWDGKSVMDARHDIARALRGAQRDFAYSK